MLREIDVSGDTTVPAFRTRHIALNDIADGRNESRSWLPECGYILCKDIANEWK